MYNFLKAFLVLIKKFMLFVWIKCDIGSRMKQVLFL